MGLFDRSKGYQEGRLMAQNPAFLRMFLANQNAENMSGTMEDVFGNAAVPQQSERQTIPMEGPQQPIGYGEDIGPPGSGAPVFPDRPMMDINQITQEAQAGTGLIGSAGSPEESRYLQARKVLGMSGQGTGLDSSLKGLDAMQNSVMSGMNQTDAGFGFEEYMSATPEQRKTYDRFKGRGFGDGTSAPSSVREYQYFSQLPPEKQQQYLGMKRAQQLVDQGTHTTNIGTGEEYSKNIPETAVQKGYGASVSQRLEGYNSYVKDSASREYELDRTVKGLDDLFKLTDNWTTGVGGKLLSYIPQTAATDWDAAKTTVVSQLGLEKLKDLKASSPTGASGFGALSEKELLLLTSYVSNLEQAQSPLAIRKSIKRIQTHLNKVKMDVVKDKVRSAKWYKNNSRNQNINRGGRYENAAPAVGADPEFEAYLKSQGG